MRRLCTPADQRAPVLPQRLGRCRHHLVRSAASARIGRWLSQRAWARRRRRTTAARLPARITRTPQLRRQCCPSHAWVSKSAPWRRSQRWYGIRLTTVSDLPGLTLTVPSVANLDLDERAPDSWSERGPDSFGNRIERIASAIAGFTWQARSEAGAVTIAIGGKITMDEAGGLWRRITELLERERRMTQVRSEERR